ncbi:hypothetical protein JCM19236_1319 [Vibrio sp. JCM 19236]|nr:hypothetical protein JCM19236_1319 [Vibrio sp. JCM 19236]
MKLQQVMAAMQGQMDEQAKLIAELQNGENPSIPSGISEELIAGLETAKVEVENKFNQGEVALKESAAEAKAAVEAQRAQDAQALQAVIAKLESRIADVESGSNPSIPGNELNEVAVAKLEQASKTLQAKMGKARVALETVAEGAKNARNNNGDVGINPPSNGGGYPMDHEFGSIGQDQAIDYVSNKADVALSDNLDSANEYTNSQIAQTTQRIDEGEDELHQVISAMQTQMAEQAKLIAELQNGENPSIPSGISEELIAGLETAKVEVEDKFNQGEVALKESAAEAKVAAEAQRTQDAQALQAVIAKLESRIADLESGSNPSVPGNDLNEVAVAKLEQASKTLQAKMGKARVALETVAEGAKNARNNNGDIGINPPSNGGGYPMDHEFGSIGQGQATAYVSEKAIYAQDATLESANAYTDQQVTFLNDRMDDLLEDMDSVMATSQAVTAARPYLSTNQTNAIGVGLGQAGSSEAISVGYAHRITENWTANANVSGTKGNEVDVSFGLGASYAW